MTDTVRTTSALTAFFADGQLPGSITPQMVRDFVASFDVTRTAVVNVKDAPYLAVGNGVTDDTTAVQRAANSLGTLGGTILIPPSRNGYLVSRVTLGSNVRVMGAGLAGELKQGSQLTAIFHAAGQRNVSLINVATYGNGGYSNGWTDDSHPDIGFYASQCSYVKVEGCIFRNHALAGVWGDSVDDFVVRDNYIQGTHNLGSTISDNGMHQYGIVATRTLNSASTGVLITGNEICDTAFGIDVGDVSGARVVGNHVHEIVGQHGCYLGGSQMIVSNNFIKDAARDGIKIYYGTTGVQTDVVCIGNVVLSSATTANSGINVASSSGGTCTDVVVSGNVIRNTNSQYSLGGIGYGITTGGVDRIVISNNEVYRVRAHGVNVDSTQTMNDLNIIGNTLSAPQQYGILANALYQTRTRIMDNSITDGVAGFDGIKISAAGSDVLVQGNQIKGAFTNSVNHLGANDTRVVGNLMQYGSQPLITSSNISVYEGNIDNKEMTSYAQSIITAAEWDRNIKANATSSVVTVLLLSAAGRKGRTIKVVKVDSSGNSVVLKGAGAEVMNSSNILGLKSQWSFVEIISDGGNWQARVN